MCKSAKPIARMSHVPNHIRLLRESLWARTLWNVKVHREPSPSGWTEKKQIKPVFDRPSAFTKMLMGGTEGLPQGDSNAPATSNVVAKIPCGCSRPILGNGDIQNAVQFDLFIVFCKYEKLAPRVREPPFRGVQTVQNRE